jgi:hypothetical protein
MPVPKTEDNGSTPGTPTEPTTPEAPDQPPVTPLAEPSINQQAKDLPWVKDLMADSAKYKQVQAEAAAAEEAARQKKLEDEGRFEEFKSEHKSKLEAMEKRHAADLLNRDLKTEFLKAGFSDDDFIDGAILKYNAENHKSPAEYAALKAADESKKVFLAGTPARTPHTPPGKLGAGGADWTKEKLHQMETSNDKKERAAARAYLRDYRSRHGKYPE